MTLAGLILSLLAGTADSAANLVPRGGEVEDPVAYLIWARCSVGQQWDDANAECKGDVRNLTYQQALQAVSGEWRLPTASELATLIDERRAFEKLRPTINEEIFPGMDWNNLAYWTSSLYGRHDYWRVHFDIGKAIPFGDPRMVTAAVRLVKDKPRPKP